MIKVKPLVWDSDCKYAVIIRSNLSKYQIMCDLHSYDEKDIFIVQETYYGSEFTSDRQEFSTLEEAKAWVQEKWNEYVLSLIEIKEI